MKIAYVTGSRADFGRAYHLLKLIEKKFELQVIATGMHFLVKHGSTIKEVERCFSIYPVNVFADNQAHSFGHHVTGIADALAALAPDYVLLLGDRAEILASAIAAAHLGIPILHIGGGQSSGSLDNKFRDAITIFSDYHFVATKENCARVLALGADCTKTFIVGSPDLDVIRLKNFTPPEKVAQKYSISSPLLVAQMHPVTGESTNEVFMKFLMDALVQLRMETFITYPNTDAGGQDMVRVLETYRTYPFIHIYPNVPYEDYLGIMSMASAMVGNSSAGVIEAASFNLPVVNLGNRQKNRQRSLNVVDIRGDTTSSIVDAVRSALQRRGHYDNIYGDGKTSEKIMVILERVL